MGEEKKLNLGSLTAVIISSMIGAGIFNLISDMASQAAPGAIILGWLVTGIGMGTLVFSFKNLSEKRPELDAGIYRYAKEGFGDYMGFNSAWGYWLSALLGNVAFGTLTFSALGYFFKTFGNGQNIYSVLGASIVLWIIHYITIKGSGTASFVNFIVTVAKVIPIIMFIIVVIFAFKAKVFSLDFWGTISGNFEFSSVATQVKNVMLTTVWVFIGVEGGIIYSGRAKRAKDVGKATLIAFTSVLVLYALVTILSFGVMPQDELAKMPKPSMAHVLESIIGKPGAIIINIGVIISIIGCWLATTMYTGEVPYRAAQTKNFPRLFTKVNENGAPTAALWVTNMLIQIFLFTFLINDSAYNFMYSLSASAILLPYGLVAFYQLKYSLGEEKGTKHRVQNIILGIVSSVFVIWVTFASGIEYFLLTMFVFAAGFFVFAWVQKENKRKLFATKLDLLFAAIVLILFITCIIQIATGAIDLRTI
ncbi:arginine-ornithine antiporter [Neobacillus sp. OS1-32]|jgi:arginine:ornithine antiporter/lysine permease|uniref:arginine-ornithine antiporter n=1 Tax=Neobacillus sp. OS1-32 TaxID=3070682 RepID=UPI0027E0A312|nr:arginine-ornithine antiporter [Neobacillus sp. OS1-32]WML29926.1 arginine-ornithine antiporter [Neobacillus sp. OS1-32]